MYERRRIQDSDVLEKTDSVSVSARQCAAGVSVYLYSVVEKDRWLTGTSQLDPSLPCPPT